MDHITKIWDTVSHFTTTTPLIQNSAKFLSENRRNIIPAVIGVVLGGTVFYIWRNGGKWKKLQKSKPKGEPEFRLEVFALPPEARTVIWSKLKYEDLLKLRLVSSMTKEDVDFLVGLKILISTRKMEKYEFSQKVALQSCFITDLTMELGPDFFIDPFLMQNIDLVEKTPISLTNIANVLTPCINLKKLKLRFIHSTQITEISEIVIRAMENMPDLTTFQLIRMAAYPIQEKFFPLNPTDIGFNCPKHLKRIQVEIPDIENNQVAAWKYFLEQQTYLQDLTVNLGAVHWDFFVHIIPQNPNLRQIGLLGVKSFRIETENESAFNWAMFENCSKLRSFELSSPRTAGPHGMESIHTINFELFPCRNMEEFHVSRVILTPQDVHRIYREMPKLKRGSLDHIGEAGTARAEELSWAFQQEQEQQREEWFTRERFWDVVVHSVIGLSLISLVIMASKTHQQFVAPTGPV